MPRSLLFTLVALLSSGCSSATPPASVNAQADTGAGASPDTGQPVSAPDAGGGGNSGGDATTPIGTDDASMNPDTSTGPLDAGGPFGADAPVSTDGGRTSLNPQVLALMTKVAKYEMAPQATAGCAWQVAAFYVGLMATYRSILSSSPTDAAAILANAKAWGMRANWDVCTASTNGPTFADNQCCTQTYIDLDLLDTSHMSAFMIQKPQAVFDSMIATPVAGRTLWWWCDALFMAPAAMAEMGVATGNNKYFTLLDTLYWDSKAFLFDPAKGLFWRDKNFLNTTTYWSRGNGWVIGGLARILDYLPTTDARYADYVTLLKTMAAALAPLQGADGLWRSNLLNPSAFPNPETSGTGFFVYAMAWGIAHGVLDRATYLPIVRKGWDGTGATCVANSPCGLVGALDAQGHLGWVQGVGLQPGPATQTSYQPYATGAFLLAGSEVAKLF
jgi:unsaturated rhamnogalacturonyl hydrolase